MEQRYRKLGKSAMEAFEDLKKVSRDEYLFRARVFEWFARFRDGRESIEDDPRPGLPVSIRTEENLQKVRNLVNEDRRITSNMITDMLNINKETARNI
jgi:hypothetical protein